MKYQFLLNTCTLIICSSRQIAACRPGGKFGPTSAGGAVDSGASSSDAAKDGPEPREELVRAAAVVRSLAAHDQVVCLKTLYTPSFSPTPRHGFKNQAQ